MVHPRFLLTRGKKSSNRSLANVYEDQSAKLQAMDTVCPEQSGRDPDRILQAAGWAAGLEQGVFYLLGPGNGQHLSGTVDKLLADIPAVFINNRCPMGQHIMTISAPEISGGSRGRQSAKLFRTERNPVHPGKLLQAAVVGFTFAVVTGTQPRKAGTDQAFFCGNFDINI